MASYSIPQHYFDVFNSFYECYPRATEFCLNLWGLTEAEVASWILHSSSRWRNFKKTAHYVSKSWVGREFWANYDHQTCVEQLRRLVNHNSLMKWEEPVDKPVQRELF